jgi:hypothetical protein
MKIKNSVEQERKVLLAIFAIKKKKISSISEAARLHNISRTTLRDRLRDRTNRVEKRANGHKLTPNEKKSLVRWILSLAQRGASSRSSHVQDMANILLSKRDTTRVQPVGQNWAYNFIKRRDELKTQFSRRYNHRRAKCENPKIIKK